MKKKGLLKVIIPISLILTLAVGLPLMGGCRPAVAPPEVAPPEVAPPEVAPPEVAPPEVAPPAEVEPIKVGVPLPMTGWFVADAVTYFQGMSLAIDEINAEGGLLGRPLRVIRFDHQNFEPEIVMEGADYLCGVEKVDVVHAGWAGYGADVKAYGKYDIPYFYANASASSIEVFRSDPELYWNTLMNYDTERPYGLWAADVHMMLPYEYPNNKIVLLSADDPWCREITAGFKERAEEEGWEVVLYDFHPYGTSEWGGVLTKIRTLDPAIIAIENCSPPDLVTFFRQFMEDPTNSLVYLFYGGGIREFVEILGEEGDGLTMFFLNGVALPVGQNPVAQDFIDKFRLKFGIPPQSASVVWYDTVYFWAEAVEKVGDPSDYRAICQYLTDTTFQCPSGIGTCYFDEDNKIPINPDLPPLFFQIQGGELVLIYLGTEKYVDWEGTAYEFQVPPWIE